jgi:hypothetical protein
MSSIDECQVLSTRQENGAERHLSTTTMMMASNVASRIQLNRRSLQKAIQLLMYLAAFIKDHDHHTSRGSAI